ncbi:MAG: bifunctional diaminohydroxyphosphoribosylaminopyrimidine deaminase/5-amino-6-(5-phosphoribosylamino)uracil reductase RibD [Pseudomonadota bacterium]
MESSPIFDPAAMMQMALRLGKSGQGLCAPNPSVGCVLVQHGKVVGSASTAPGGRPHAEALAIQHAHDLHGIDLHGASAFVTLEPCAHHGKTPPCCDHLIQAGITDCFVAITDPDPRVKGKGIARMRQAGINVSDGVCAKKARWLHRAHLLWHHAGRPCFALKSAISLDGRIAVESGESQWITSELARQHAHDLRARHDGILTGIETVRHDNPQLGCRLLGYPHCNPRPIILDSHLRICDGASIIKRQPVIICATGHGSDRAKALADQGCRILFCKPGADGRPDPALIAAQLGTEGFRHILIEAGGTVAASFMRACLIDEWHLYRGAICIGAEGYCAIGALGTRSLAQASRFQRASSLELDGTIYEVLKAQSLLEQPWMNA